MILFSALIFACSDEEEEAPADSAEIVDSAQEEPAEPEDSAEESEEAEE